MSTHIAGNVTTDTTSLGLSSLVCLNVLETRPEALASASIDEWGELLTPRPERIVRDCLTRNMSFHLLRQEDQRSHLPRNNKNSMKNIPSSTIGRAHFMARECLQQSDTPGAIVIYKALLQKQPHQVGAQRADTLSKLAVLCMIAGHNQEAAKYSSEALSLHRENSRPLHAAVSAVEVGLVQFGSNKLGRALKLWREALQMCCMAMGYDHPHVAVLLNNIGVLHFETGDLVGSLKVLNESVELQRMMLRSTHLNLEFALHHLATTMGNLAMAYERKGQCDKSISLLQESLSLYESMNNPKIEDTMLIVSCNIERLLNVNVNNSSEGSHSGDQSQRRQKSDDDSGVVAESHQSQVIDGLAKNPALKTQRSAAAIFGNSDANLSSKKAHSVAASDDNHDFLLLGPLAPASTPMQQVRETVLAWFGTDSFSFASMAKLSPATPRRKNPPSSVDSDGSNNNNNNNNNNNALDDELQLAEIHLQAVELLERNEAKQALELLRRTLLAQRQRHGNIHHLVGSSLHNIGMVLLFSKQYVQAHPCFVDAVHIRSEALGKDHPDVAASKMKLGLIQLAGGELEEARRTFRDIREMFLGALGYGHPQFAKIMNNLGVVLYHFGDLPGAMRTFELAYEYQRQRHEDGLGGSEIADLGIANSLCNIGFVFAKQQHTGDAVDFYEQALQVRRKHLKKDDRKVLEIQRNIEFLLATGGNIYYDDDETGCDAPSCMMDLFGAAFAR
jgi:tetratricopeptide (TPR) repeat protein